MKSRARVGSLLTFLFLAFYIGGAGLVSVSFSVIVVAALFDLFHSFRHGRGMLASIAVVCCWVYLWSSFALPVLRDMPGLSVIFVRPLVENGFQAVIFPDGATEISQTGALVALLTPGVVAAVIILSVRQRRGVGGSILGARPLLGWLPGVALVVPLALMALLKLSDPWRFLALGMSGDGRNHFLATQMIRSVAGDVQSPLALSAPELPHAFAALFSAANGSSGTLQVGDIRGIVIVWVVSAAILSVSCAVAFSAPQQGRRPGVLLGAAVITACCVVSSSPFLLTSSLVDGFFSLYFGTALLALLVVLAALTKPSPLSLVVLVAGTIALMGGYTFLAPVMVGVVVLDLFLVLHGRVTRERRGIAMVSTSVLLVAVAWGLIIRGGESFRATAILPGSVTPVTSGVLYVFAIGFFAMGLVTRGDVRRFSMTPLTAVVSGLVLVSVIENLSENRTPGNSYYGSKVIIGVGSAAAVVVFLIAGFLWSQTQRNGLARLAVGASAAVMIAMPAVILERASPLDRPWSSIADGGRLPDSASLRLAVERWGEPPYLWFRVADDPPGSGNLRFWADRSLMFWSPVTWRQESPQWGPLWDWVYFDMATHYASVLCMPIDRGVETIFTRDPQLALEIAVSCGPSDVEVVVLPEAKLT